MHVHTGKHNYTWHVWMQEKTEISAKIQKQVMYLISAKILKHITNSTYFLPVVVKYKD